MPIQIIHQDITEMTVDAVVNAANTELLMGGGVCGAIFKAAGAEKLQKACDKLSPIATGEGVLTPAFNLPAKHIIHVAGPIYSCQSPAQSEVLLRNSYRNALAIAADHKCSSIAFPLISSGIYGYPKMEALKVALETIQNFLLDHEMEVYLTIFDREMLFISQSLLDEMLSDLDKCLLQHTI